LPKTLAAVYICGNHHYYGEWSVEATAEYPHSGARGIVEQTKGGL
jgi:hypothetical protein